MILLMIHREKRTTIILVPLNIRELFINIPAHSDERERTDSGFHTAVDPLARAELYPTAISHNDDATP